ncbi:DUF2336 domain-containing protein [Sphingomonas sp.]|uniref:DUF2336 domain-containing protein n=1 Tax=Sphingomonas sp. TaxID=28214 RepID=UPI0025EB7E75|nr:DUF2336 domain-containing protein [Sphingomonas sp.]MBV9528992.1 DUF2336 domain-containing protein [Sphingomonas sp.]
MMPEEWPILAGETDQPRGQSRSRGRDRLRTVREDFFLDPGERLTEQERALMTAMLHCLVSDVIDEIRAALPVTVPANDGSNLSLIQRLSDASLLDRTWLVRLLLRRADEERISTAAKSRSGRREARALQGLVSHSDGAVAAAAMSLIIARGRRRDRFGQCLLHFDDLPVDDATALVHAVAAALRPELAKASRPGDADQMLAEAARDILTRQDPSSSIEALSATLVRLLDEEEALTDELIVSAGLEGEMIFVAHALARRADVRGGIAFDELMSGDARRTMAVMRMGGMARQSAAGLLAGIGDLLGIGDPGRAIALFDRLGKDEVEDARAWLTTHPQYRRAVAAIEDI